MNLDIASVSLLSNSREYAYSAARTRISLGVVRSPKTTSAMSSSDRKYSSTSSGHPSSSSVRSTSSATRQFPCSMPPIPPSSMMLSGVTPERRRMSTISARSIHGPAPNLRFLSIIFGFPYFSRSTFVRGFMNGVKVPSSSRPSSPGIRSFPFILRLWRVSRSGPPAGPLRQRREIPAADKLPFRANEADRDGYAWGWRPKKATAARRAANRAATAGLIVLSEYSIGAEQIIPSRLRRTSPQNFGQCPRTAWQRSMQPSRRRSQTRASFPSSRRT
mmetsp:Transcript_22525/g.45234  ORF Transcript_22525/g.45234 Transcript_22525/m.45234 type:complete len:275 (-) Transcript_22525:768-1592(-)